jgi:hypothetical protein
MGRCSIDLSKLEHELTHELWVDLEEGTGKLFLLLTISGRTNFGPPIADLDKFQLEDDGVAERRERSFHLRNTFKGQLISKSPFGVFKSTKKPTKFFNDFCPSL